MRTLTHTIADIDELTSVVLTDGEWQYDYVQLSPGPLNFETRVVELPGLVLFWNHFGSRMRITESYTGNKVIYGLVFPADKPFLFQGHEFPANHAAIQHPGTEQYYVAPEGMGSLMIYVDRELIAATGLGIGNIVENKVPTPALQALVRECRLVTRTCQQLSANDDHTAVEKMLRNGIMDRLAAALEPWATATPDDDVEKNSACREYLLVRKAEQEMTKIGLGTRPSIEQLAGILEVSRRTLYYAFNKWLGMGPNAYFEILRLHAVRKRLLAGAAPITRVTDAANELGFNHLGRFSGEYYRFFGEYPSETLVRENLIHSTASSPLNSNR